MYLLVGSCLFDILSGRETAFSCCNYNMQIEIGILLQFPQRYGDLCMSLKSFSRGHFHQKMEEQNQNLKMFISATETVGIATNF